MRSGTDRQPAFAETRRAAPGRHGSAAVESPAEAGAFAAWVSSECSLAVRASTVCGAFTEFRDHVVQVPNLDLAALVKGIASDAGVAAAPGV